MNYAEVDPDVRMMLAFQEGDETAFEALYRNHRLPVYRFCYRILRRQDQAEEAAQEVFVRVYRSRERYRPTARFKTWLYRMATNLCLNETRRASFTKEVAGMEGPEPQASENRGPLRLIQAQELAEAIEIALDKLPERQRVAVVLARYQGCTLAEISAVLDLSVGGVKALLHRARDTLRSELQPYLPDKQGKEAG